MPVEFDEQKSFNSAYKDEANATGIIGMLIRKGVVSDQKQAEIALFIVAVIAFALAIFIFLHTTDSGPVHSDFKAQPIPPGATLP